MRVCQVTKPGQLEFVERPIPEPAAGQVRIQVQACGVCHSDSLTVEGHWPGISYPRVPGHEVAGVIDAVGSGVTNFKTSQRVGVGWNGGFCGQCDPCRRGELFACVTQRVTGVTYDGGYADYVVAPASAVARLPQELSPVEAAPLMCAGITTYNALRNSGARPGETIAVLGLGGLGHLGVQFAKKMGYNTIAIARGKDKEELALQLGAAKYIDSTAGDPAEELQKLGGAKTILATVTAGDAMAAAIGGLDVNGTLLIIGATMKLEVPSLFLLNGRRAVKGWYSGIASDSEDTLQFSARTGVQSMNEVVPFGKAPEGYARMMSGKARFRVVLKM
jgi:alcohol dehydrogenase/propanol-preferring alcohol dehydrogenase